MSIVLFNYLQAKDFDTRVKIGKTHMNFSEK